MDWCYDWCLHGLRQPVNGSTSRYLEWCANMCFWPTEYSGNSRWGIRRAKRSTTGHYVFLVILTLLRHTLYYIIRIVCTRKSNDCNRRRWLFTCPAHYVLVTNKKGRRTDSGSFHNDGSKLEEYTFRSALEAGVWVTSWWVTFIVTRSFWIATPVGTFVSIAMVIMSDCLGYGANAGAGGEKTAMESPVGCQDEKAKLKNGHDDKNSKLSSGSNAFAKETKQNEEAVTSRHTTNLCNQRTQQAGCLPEVESRFFTLDEWLSIVKRVMRGSLFMAVFMMLHHG